MRFSAPRSESASPIRGKPRRSSTFGLQSDSDSEDYDSELESSFDSDIDDDVSIASTSSASSSAFSLVEDITKLSIRPRHITRTPLEERQIQETVASIRLRTRYDDPYEEWEKRMRKDAFKTARKEYTIAQNHRYEEQTRVGGDAGKLRLEESEKQKQKLHKELETYRASLAEAEAEEKMAWQRRDKELWDKVEAAIKLEEDKAAKRLEEVRKFREEEERKRKEAELKKRLAEEKRIQEEEQRKKAQEEEKRAEEERNKEEKEAEEQRSKLEKDKHLRLSEETELRRMMSFSPAEEDWRVARTNLQNLKTGPIRFVKSNKETKAEWGRLRRQIVPKIGQLTNDAQSISQISRQLIEIAKPSNGHSHDSSIYIALCSSLAKAILLQAETEVTAEKRSAAPLAQVTFALLETLEHFPSIFFAKLVQRCGGWPIPLVVPPCDIDELPWNSKEDRIKASGVRKSVSSDGRESTEEYSNRVSALMRVYFHILKIRPVKQPLDTMFQLPRAWTWFARMTGDTRLLRNPVTPQLLYTGLDVLGLEVLDVWGQQWVKMLALIHEGIVTGYDNGKLIGGETTEGAAARTRVMVSLENIAAGVQS